MSSLNLNEDPFWQVQDKLDQAQSQYSKMELVIKGASKLLGDYKAGNICKELKKLKEKDIASLEATNTTLSSQIQELKMILALKKDEIWMLKEQQAECLGQI